MLSYYKFPSKPDVSTSYLPFYKVVETTRWYYQYQYSGEERYVYGIADLPSSIKYHEVDNIVRSQLDKSNSSNLIMKKLSLE